MNEQETTQVSSEMLPSGIRRTAAQFALNIARNQEKLLNFMNDNEAEFVVTHDNQFITEIKLHSDIARYMQLYESLMDDKPDTYMDIFARNHNTVSVALSLKCDDTDWVNGLKDEIGVKFVEFFFEEGTPPEKVKKHLQLAEEHTLRVRGCHLHLDSADIEIIIAYTEEVKGILLKRKDD